MINSFYLNHHVLVICTGCLKNRIGKQNEVTSGVRRKTAVIDDGQNGKAAENSIWLQVCFPGAWNQSQRTKCVFMFVIWGKLL